VCSSPIGHGLDDVSSEGAHHTTTTKQAGSVIIVVIIGTGLELAVLEIDNW